MVEALARALSRDDLAADAGSGIWDTKIRAIVRQSVERVVVHGEKIQIVPEQPPYSQASPVCLSCARHRRGDR